MIMTIEVSSLLLIVCLTHKILGFGNQEPPISTGDVEQYFLVNVKTKLSFSCPYNVSFYVWKNIKTNSRLNMDTKNITIHVTSNVTDADVYQCEAVNGFGRSTAVFVAKGIDRTTQQFKIDCNSEESGPCFLVSSLNNDYFDHEVYDNNETILDCRSLVSKSTNLNDVTYSWKRLSMSDADLKLNNEFHSDNRMLGNISLFTQKPTTINDIRKWESLVLLKNVTKQMEGYFQCTVTSGLKSISRIFRLRIKDPKTGRLIVGPLYRNITVPVGSSEIFECEARNAERPPRWTKRMEENDPVEPEKEINWNGVRYKYLQGSLDADTDNGKIISSKTYINNLRLTNIQDDHAGTYACVALYKRGWPEIKFIYLTVIKGQGDFSRNNFPIYIAVPTVVFVICLSVIIYCFIQRQIRQKANLKNRAGRNTTASATNSSSANGSSSGSKNISNSRHPMLPTSTISSKSQFISSSNMNNVSSSGYGTSHGPYGTGYAPAVMNYNYSAPVPYMATSNPSSIDIDHTCAHHGFLTHNPQHMPYDSDSTPSPPPPTSVTEAISTLANNYGNPNAVPPYSISGPSLNYSPNNQSSQIYPVHQPSLISSHGSSSLSATSPNSSYQGINNTTLPSQQPVYQLGVVFSA